MHDLVWLSCCLCVYFQVSLSGEHVQIHVYQLQQEAPSHEDLEDDGGDLPAAKQWLLPSAQFHGLWESLIYDSSIKSSVSLRLVYEHPNDTMYAIS